MACYHSRILHIDWRTALTFVGRQPAWKLRIGIGGAFMLVLPPLGWVLALGYRSLVGNRLVDGGAPLPAWNGHVLTAFRRGIASSGVILAYLAPSLVAYWVAGVRDVGALSQHWRELAVFAGGVAVFPPLCIPILPIAYAVRYDWLDFTIAEVALVLGLSLGGILILPAAFLQVAQHRRFSAAFRTGAALRLIAAVPRLYAEAWIVALSISALAVIVLPLAPWLLFWSYLVISHLFLQTLGALRRVDRGPRPRTMSG